jgi:hypothetical protein
MKITAVRAQPARSARWSRRSPSSHNTLVTSTHQAAVDLISEQQRFLPTSEGYAGRGFGRLSAAVVVPNLRAVFSLVRREVGDPVGVRVSFLRF